MKSGVKDIGPRRLVAVLGGCGLLCMALALPQARAQGPSFDCSSASHGDERTICDSEELSALDRAMAFKFKYALTIRDPSIVRGFGREVLRQRRNCNDDAPCIKNVMTAAIRAYSEGNLPTQVEAKPEPYPRSFAYNSTDPNTVTCSYNTDIPIDIVLAACAALLEKQNQPVVLIHSIRADAYSRNNQPGACINEENAALSLDPQYEPQHSSDLTKRGTCYYDLGDYDHAIDDFTNAIKINPAAIDALYLRGMSYYSNGNYPLAIADYTARLQIRSDADTLASRGAAYNFTDYYNLAAVDLEKSISLNPRSPYPHRHYGVAKGQSHMYDSAIEEFTAAINLDSTYSLAYADRGVAYFDKGDYSRALVDLNQALNVGPKNLDVLYSRGLTYLFLNDAKKAIADLSMVITLEPNFAKAFNYRGLAFMGMKGYGAAIEDFKESVRLYPQYVESHLHLGEAYLAQNNNAAAMAEFNTVIQLKPDDQDFLDEAQHAVDALKAGKPFTPPGRQKILLSLLLK